MPSSRHNGRAGKLGVVAILVCVLTACTVLGIRNLRSPSGVRSLQFFNKQQLVLSKNVSTGFPTAAWGPFELGVVPKLDVGSNNVRASYEANPPPGRDLGTEVLLFARDPRETLDILSTIINDPEEWKAQTIGCQLPSAVTLPYPGTVPPFGGGPPLPVSQGLAPNLFWDQCSTPNKPAAVQTAVIYDRGMCSYQVDTQAILDELQDQLWAQFFPSVIENGCADAERPWSNAAAYIQENPFLNPDILPRGGFILNSYLKADIHVPFTQDLNVRYNYQFEFALEDGILTVISSPNRLDVSGHDDDKTRDMVAAALEQQLPSAIHDKALDKQRFDFSINADCAPVMPNDTSVPVNSDVCELPMKVLLDGMNVAAQNGTLARLGLSPMADLAKLRATIQDSIDGKYRNWRCAPHINTAGEEHNRCDYTLRAKRLISLPDKVELVWFDDVHETWASAVPLLVFLLASKDRSAHVGEICQPPSATTMVRRFATSIREKDVMHASSKSCAMSVLEEGLTSVWKHSWLRWVGGLGF